MSAASPRKPSGFNLVDPDDYAAHGYPHEIWTRLRREDPVHWWDETDGMPFWAITKHADIVTIGKQPERVPERAAPGDHPPAGERPDDVSAAR